MLPEKSGKSLNSANKLSGEANVIPGNKFDRKLNLYDSNDGGDDGVEPDDGDEGAETDYIVIKNGDLPDDDDYVDLNGPNENEN